VKILNPGKGERQMSEKLLHLSTILIFGRIVEDLKIVAPTDATTPAPVLQKGANTLLKNEIGTGTDTPPRAFARVYAFSYEGHYYDLSKPVLILVHGSGDSVSVAVEHCGLPSTGRVFPNDIKVWAYDKSDISIRLEPETGTFEQILLDAELRADRLHINFGGEKARLRGDGGSGDGGM
jgi:hypothetical protein